MPYASGWEIVWFLVASYGVVAAMIAVVYARTDRLQWKHTGSPQQRFLTRIIYVSTRGHLMVQVLFFSAVCWSLFHPAPHPVLLGFILPAHAILVSLSIATIRWRYRLALGNYNGEIPDPDAPAV